MTLQNDSTVCVRNTVPSFSPPALSLPPLSPSVASIKVSLKTGGGTQMLSLRSCSCDRVRVCIQTKHACEGACKQQDPAAQGTAGRRQQVDQCSSDDLQMGFVCTNTIHRHTGTPARLTPHESNRNKPEHYFELSEQMEADVLVRRQAAQG